MGQKASLSRLARAAQLQWVEEEPLITQYHLAYCVSTRRPIIPADRTWQRNADDYSGASPRMGCGGASGLVIFMMHLCRASREACFSANPAPNPGSALLWRCSESRAGQSWGEEHLESKRKTSLGAR